MQVESEEPVIGDEDVAKVTEKSPAENGISQSGDEEEHLDDNDESGVTTHQRHRRYKKRNPTYFFIGGGNGGSLVDAFLTDLGWERIFDKNREDYKLKWCEIKSHNNYHCFREGEQLCYQIPNNKLLTTKIGLLTSLQEYDRVMNKVKKGKPRIMRYQDFFPETYRLDIRDDREAFFEAFVDGELWISKPTGMNQGKGIYLIRDKADFTRLQEKLSEIEEDLQSSRKLPFRAPMARIVQRYVPNPLLLNGRKFDVRNYMLVACTNPLVVFYRDGYCRLTCMPYDHNSTDLTGHLTNQFMQKKNPLYEEVKDETVWSMDRFNDYVNEHFMHKKNLPEDWVHTVLRRRCQQVLLHCFQAVRHKLECRLGFFDLLGCDFLVDDDFKISLLEMNCNPALHTNCEPLKEVIPSLVEETLKLSMEIFDKANKRERIMPLASQNEFVLLYNGDMIEAAERRERMQSAAEARRRAQSAQRRKRFVPGQFTYRRTATTTAATASTTTTTASSSTATTSTTASASSSTSPPNQHSVVPTASPYRITNLPSSTVTARTTASQLRVVQSKSNPEISVKPFYAGGSVSSRPYSAPRFNRKYAQVEARVVTHNTTNYMESPRRNSINNAALTAAASSHVVNYAQKARSVLLAPKRQEVVVDDYEGEKRRQEDEEFIEELRDELDAMDRANIFEQILEEPDQLSDDEEDEELLAIATCDSPESSIRRPSAKLPSSYHNSSMETNSGMPNGVSTWPRFTPSQKSFSVHRKVSKIASLSVKGNFGVEIPLPPVGAPPLSPRLIADQPQKIQFRAPTTVRIRQSLPATTCTLEIGPRSRRGLIAVSMAAKAPHLHEKHAMKHRRNNPFTKLKFVSSSTGVVQSETNIPSSLLFLAAAHLQEEAAIEGGTSRNSMFGAGTTTKDASQKHRNNNKSNNNIKNKLLADSSTQTNTRSRATHVGEEKVIWRLRSRVSEAVTNRVPSDGSQSPGQQSSGQQKGQKMPLRVPVVVQSPGLISPRKSNDYYHYHTPQNPKKTQANHNAPSHRSPRESKDTSSSRSGSDDATSNDVITTTALSKVVAVARAAPTRPHKSKVSADVKSAPRSDVNDDLSLMAAG